VVKDLLPWYQTDLRTVLDRYGGELTPYGLSCQYSRERGSDINTQGPDVQQPQGVFLRMPGAEVPSGGLVGIR